MTDKNKEIRISIVDDDHIRFGENLYVSMKRVNEIADRDKNETCGYCHYDEDDHFKSYVEGTIESAIGEIYVKAWSWPEEKDPKISLVIGSSEDVEFTEPINYCPMCGRRVRKEPHR